MVAQTAGLLVRLEAVRMVTYVIAVFSLAVLRVLRRRDGRLALFGHRLERTRERVPEMRRRSVEE